LQNKGWIASIPFSTSGIIGFPKDPAAWIFFRGIKDYFEVNPNSGLLVVRVTLFDAFAVEAFVQAWDEMEE
jgi:hypothetical protein